MTRGGDEERRRVPVRVPEAKVTGLPLGPAEGFLLALIDGLTTAEELADLSGLPLADVQATVDRLVAYGAVVWGASPVPSPSQRPPAPPGGAGAERARRSSRSVPAQGRRTPSPRRPAPEAAPAPNPEGARVSETPSRGLVRTQPPPPGVPLQLYDPQELEEPDVDLDPERRRLVLDHYYQLDTLDHYALLGVGRDADKAAIRTAYFMLSRRFHPDTLFRKRLGSFKPKMEAVFKRLTEAYETLSRESRRADYDGYLDAREQTRAAAEALERGRRAAEAIARGTPAVAGVRAAGEAAEAPEAGLAAPAAVAPTPTPAPAPAAPPADELVLDPPELSLDPPAPWGAPGATGAPPAAETTSAPARPASSPEEVDARRRKLAAARIHSMLGSRRAPPPRPSAPGQPPPATPRPGEGDTAAGSGPAPDSRREALRDLATSLRRTADLTGGVQPSQRYLDDARKAEERGDFVAASNALRLAMAHAPDDESIATEHARLRTAVAQKLADTYERQARYEEGHGRWKEAAESWARVCEGRPEDPAARVAAAEAFLEAVHDMPQAKLHAEKAVQLAPGLAHAHRALGRVYVALGMTLNARRALEAARKLDPDDRIVNTLLDELRGRGSGART